MQCVQNEPLKTKERFMYFGIKVPFNHRWSECAIHNLEMRKPTYYALENIHIYNGGEFEYCTLKGFLYDTFVMFILVYGD